MLDIANVEVTVHENIGCIKFSINFCTIYSQNYFINTINKSCVAGKKSHFGSKNRERRRFKLPDIALVARRLGIVQIDWYSLQCQRNCKLSSWVLKFTGFVRYATTPSAIESWISGYFILEFKLTTAVQKHAICH